MITLKTLKDVTRQQVFDQVVNHMLTQNAKSYNETDGCLYRGPNGLKCAVGCIIADEEYKEEWEGMPWINVVAEHLDITQAHSLLLWDLQVIHDKTFVMDWEKELRGYASRNNLEWTWV